MGFFNGDITKTEGCEGKKNSFFANFGFSGMASSSLQMCCFALGVVSPNAPIRRKERGGKN
jgi:hypothetical protein